MARTNKQLTKFLDSASAAEIFTLPTRTLSETLLGDSNW
ncbi:hypothetical protein SLEP1_g27131 [Rubroshorea leprosula]|uniref:Uncharacterized protein n=1 Tax=Rubroshorea leprosula TaxID=152421 RepID=A0AAV5JVH7_9ROSI|nr:hypothetical protein SLEP1_g27131 [Rubroshorea leprosula]